MSINVATALDISSDLMRLGMYDLGASVAELVGVNVRQIRADAIRECVAVCSGAANDFAEKQDSLYAAGRYDQAKACAVQVRKLLNKEATCPLSQ